jgi:feruloyl esterase
VLLLGIVALAGVVAVVAVAGTTGAVSPASGAGKRVAEPCSALAQQGFSALRDAPTHIAGAQWVGAHERTPAYCEVRATIFPKVGIAIQLPAQGWNGKLLELGCGSYCGTIELAECAEPLRRGYACVASDMGHQSPSGNSHWADDDLAAQVDFANRAAHVTLLAARAIVNQYYAQQVRRAYFMGCSTGGYLGMIEAQRFPWDFDGIIAGDPDMDEADLLMRSVWAWRVLRDAAGKPLLSHADLQLLHAAALQACDLDDGVADGIIGDPVGCPFRGDEALCKPQQKSGCLNALQLAAVRRMYTGPVRADGSSLSTRGPFPGSELAWLPDTRADTPADAPADAVQTLGDLGYNLYVPSPGQHWHEADFDFEHDYQRLGLGALYNDTNPDLRKFRAAGAKLLVYQGGSDTVEMSAIYDYYQNVEQLVGNRSDTQGFFRLYTVPGMGHCGGGEGADHIDYLSYLEGWVERGEAPDRMIGAHVEPAAKFTRPVFPYPQYARYTGQGDVNDELNFIAVTPPGR